MNGVPLAKLSSVRSITKSPMNIPGAAPGNKPAMSVEEIVNDVPTPNGAAAVLETAIATIDHQVTRALH